MDLTEQRGELRDWKVAYGFILYRGRRVFFHKSNCVPGFRPEVGAQVCFDFALSPIDPKRPPIAVNVRISKTVAQIAAEDEVRRELLRVGGV
jgi:hypothetical protein